MPTGSYGGLVDEGAWLGSSMCGGGEYDICGGRLRDNLQVVNSCCGVIQHGGLVSRSTTVASRCPSITQDLVQTREVVAGRHASRMTCKIARQLLQGES